MEFFIKWIVLYVAVMFAMVTDNLFWISDSPEYAIFLQSTFGEKVKYILKDRVLSVLKNWRDIAPAIITSLILTQII